MRLAGRRDDRVQCRFLLGQVAVPSHVYVRERPGVLEGGPGRLGADGGLIRAVGVEGRIQVNQVYALRVHAPHHVQVVARPHGTIGPVGFGHVCMAECAGIREWWRGSDYAVKSF